MSSSKKTKGSNNMLDHNALVNAMLSYSEQQFINALRSDPAKRNMHVSHSRNLDAIRLFRLAQPFTFTCAFWFQDMQVIYTHLSGMSALSKLRESALRSLCKMVRYERHPANDILYW